MNNADLIIDNNDQKFKLNQTSDTNISRITYHTDLNLSNDNVNLSESSSFQYFDTSYLHGVMKPIIIRRPAPPPPPLPPKTSIEKESNEMIIIMNDDISTIYSETIDSNSPLDLSTNDNYSSNYTIQSLSSSLTNDDKKELYRLNLSTINLHSTDIKSHLLNNTTNSLSNHQNHSSMISFSNSLPSSNYATYSIRNKNFNDDHYHHDDDGDSIDNKQQSSLNIYKSNTDDDDDDNSYLADKLMLMNDSTFLGIEDNVVTNNHKNNDEKKIQTNNDNDYYKSFRCISRLVFIFIVLVAIVLALFLIIQLIIRDYLHHHHHQKQQNDYQQQYSQYQWPYGWYNLTYLDQQQPMTAIYY